MTADNPRVRRCPRCLRPGFQGPEGRDRTSLETFTQTHHLQPGDGLAEPFRTTITDALGALVLGVLPGDQVMLQNDEGLMASVQAITKAAASQSKRPKSLSQQQMQQQQ